MRNLVQSFPSGSYIGRVVDQIQLGIKGPIDIKTHHYNRLLKENKSWIIRSSEESSSKFLPSPTGQLCSGMTFGMSLFFKETRICPETMRRSLSYLADEIPILTGRMQHQESALGKSKICDAFIMSNNEGFEMSCSSTNSNIRDIQMQSIRNYECSPLYSFPGPYYLRKTIDPGLMIRGQANLFQVEILHCSDGDILSASFAHILADGKRAFELLKRLAEMYHAIAKDKIPTGRNFRYDAWLDPRFQTKKPAPAKTQVPSLWDILHTPNALYNYLAGKKEIVNLFVSRRLIENIRSVPSHSEHLARHNLTTLDIIQALVSTLLLDIRKGRTKLQNPDVATINIDMTRLMQDDTSEDARDFHLGNGSHIMEVEIESHTKPDCDIATASSLQSKYFSAIRYNATLIRRSIQGFRADSSKLRGAIDAHASMSQMNPLLLKALFLVIGHRRNISSTTAIASFPMHQVRKNRIPLSKTCLVSKDKTNLYRLSVNQVTTIKKIVLFLQIQFNGKSPASYLVFSNPRFDWWTIIQDAGDIDPSQSGFLCSITADKGFKHRLQQHPMLTNHASPNRQLYVL